MRTALIVAALVVLAIPAHADSITEADGSIIIIPHGSQVTSNSFCTSCGVYVVDFQLSEGLGIARGDLNDGDSGSIGFTVPVSNISITWESFGPFSVSTFDRNGQGTCDPSRGECGNELVGSFLGCPDGGSPLNDALCAGTASLTGSGITSLQWENGGLYSGIDSISFTVATPEPSTLGLFAMGLLGLVVSYRARTARG
jgi:hypothetical protein